MDENYSKQVSASIRFFEYDYNSHYYLFSDSYPQELVNTILSIKNFLLECISGRYSTSNEKDRIIREHMNGNKKHFDKHRANAKQSFLKKVMSDKHTPHTSIDDKKAKELISIIVDKKKIPENLENFFRVLSRYIYRLKDKISFSDIIAITWLSTILMLDFASVICTYKALEHGVEYKIKRESFVPFK
jgi:hypothetical protein